jgi:hypothetical protein
MTGIALLSRCGLLVSLVVTVSLGGCGTFEVSHADQVLQRARSDARVALTVEPPQARIGDSLRMRVVAEQPGYLYLLQIGSADRRMSLVYPNTTEQRNRLDKPGSVTILPGPGWAMVANGPAGTGYYLAIVTEQPQDPAALRAALEQRRIDIRGRYGAAIATLREY